MNGKITLALLSVLAIGMIATMMTIPAYATVVHPIEPPLSQWNSGMSIEQIRCIDGKILMQSPDGKPACLSKNNAEKLSDRGYILIPTYHACRDYDTSIKQVAIDNLHKDAKYYLRPFYPTVGETAELTFTITHAEYRGFHESWDENQNRILTPAPWNVHELKPVDISIFSHENWYTPNFRVYDIVSNIGSKDPTVFAPYDPDTETIIAEPGKTYTVKAKVEMLHEGVARFIGVAFNYDMHYITLAVGNEKTLLSCEYIDKGETYLDHLKPVRTQSESSNEPNVLIPNENTSYGNSTSESLEPGETLMEGFTDLWEGLAETYKRQNLTDTQIIQGDFSTGFSRQEIIDFFRIYMEYNQEQLDALPIPRDIT